MRFNRISIVGVGLIGGSFALAARRAGLAEAITGWDNESVIERAQASGVIDDVEESFSAGRTSDADLVFLSAPVGGIIDFLQSRGNLIKPGAILTDAGSTKRAICRVARQSLPPEAHFIGGHPMAGSHKTGIEFADADLFRGAPYAIVIDQQPQEFSGEYRKAVEAVIEIVRRIGSLPVVITAERHDSFVARVSHAPQLLSIALSLSVIRSGEDALALAGSGFAEMTRLAESSWSVWEDICRTNADEIDAALALLIREIESVRQAISSGDFTTARNAFDEANASVRRFHARKDAMIEKEKQE